MRLATYVEQAALERVTEAEFMAQIIELAKLQGYLVYHTRDSRRSAPGFPDLVLLRPPYLTFLEVKREKGRVTTEQRQWVEKLKLVRIVQADIARPHDWPDIEAALGSRRR